MSRNRLVSRVTPRAALSGNMQPRDTFGELVSVKDVPWVQVQKDCCQNFSIVICKEGIGQAISTFRNSDAELLVIRLHESPQSIRNMARFQIKELQLSLWMMCVLPLRNAARRRKSLTLCTSSRGPWRGSFPTFPLCHDRSVFIYPCHTLWCRCGTRCCWAMGVHDGYARR